MSLRALVNDAVDLAWDVTGDLKTEMYFKAASESTYDPTTSKLVEKVETTPKFFGFLEKLSDNYLTSAGVAPAVDSCAIMVKKKDIPKNYFKFDSIVVHNVEHKVINYTDDGYIIRFIVSTRSR